MRIRKNCLIVFLAFIVTNYAHAQDSLTHSTISLNVGANNIFNKDLFQSPYTYKGTNLLVSSLYSNDRKKGKHLISLTYSGGQITSVVSPQADNQLLLLNYDYLFSLRNKTINEKFIPSLGIGIHTLLNNTNYLPEIESSVTYLSGGAFFALSGDILYHLNKRNRLNLRVGLPVFGLVYRPDFEIHGKALTKTTLIGKGNLFSVKLEYDYKLTSELSLIATYDYNYFTFDEPRSVTILQNGLLFGLKKTF